MFTINSNKLWLLKEEEVLGDVQDVPASNLDQQVVGLTFVDQANADVLPVIQLVEEELDYECLQ